MREREQMRKWKENQKKQLNFEQPNSAQTDKHKHNRLDNINISTTSNFFFLLCFAFFPRISLVNLFGFLYRCRGIGVFKSKYLSVWTDFVYSFASNLFFFLYFLFSVCKYHKPIQSPHSLYQTLKMRWSRSDDVNIITYRFDASLALKGFEHNFQRIRFFGQQSRHRRHTERRFTFKLVRQRKSKEKNKSAKDRCGRLHNEFTT